MRRTIASLLSLLCLATPAAAQPRPVAISAVEHALGASPLHMVAGHGRVSLGVTREGDVAVLTWPSPSCCDQLTYLASNALDARSRPRTGVRDGFGVNLGLALRTADSLPQAESEVGSGRWPLRYQVVGIDFVRQRDEHIARWLACGYRSRSSVEIRRGLHQHEILEAAGYQCHSAYGSTKLIDLCELFDRESRF